MAALRRRERPRPTALDPHASTPRSRLPWSVLAHDLRTRALCALGRPFADLLEFVLPQRCPGCGVPADANALLCERCRTRLPVLPTPVCARCLHAGETPYPCHRHAGFQVHAAWLYDERVALLVHALKFAARPGLARAVAPALVLQLPERVRRGALVTSVPLHAARLRERGYDQAARLAEALAGEVGAPYVPGLLRRVRATRAQSGLGAEARRRNVRGAFELLQPGWVRGRRVLVVDDVLTTGATMGECLALLSAAGARTRGAVMAWAP